MTETWLPATRIERGPYDAGSHGGPISTPVLGVADHITTNDFDPGGFFANPANQASSHLWIADDGTLVQFLPLEVASWAQAGGNGSYWSIEVSGQPGTAMNDAQIATFASTYAALAASPLAGFGPTIANAPGELGLIGHGQGGMAWGGHFDCPGDARLAQRQAILDLAQEGPDMPLSDTDLQKIADDAVKPLLVDFWNNQFSPALVAIKAELDAIKTKTGA